MKRLACLLLLASSLTIAQQFPAGVMKGYAGEWSHVSDQLVSLAEATPQEKFAWRPAAGVRSTSEVYMHLVRANYWFLSQIDANAKMPAELAKYKTPAEGEKAVTNKEEIIAWLKKSLEAVRVAHAAAKPEDLAKTVHFEDRDPAVDGIYLRIIIHENEHMGQLIAYARMSGVTPPWSQ